MSLLNNLILNTDSYKASHYLQYPPQTEYVSSYIESRGGEFEQTVFFGLQLFIKKYLQHPITHDDINHAEKLIHQHGIPFNRAGWEHIVNHHQGKLPLAIEAVAEGSIIPTHHVLLQIVNTDPACYWLTNYIETALLRAIWYPTTVATLSWHCKKIIARYLQETADNMHSLDFKLHDFGSRGVSSLESATIGGLAHLVNFQGSDTLSGVVAAFEYYNESMAAYSIPAAEHSTITSWGKDQEADAYAFLCEQFAGKNKLFAVVSDSYDLWHAIDHIWAGKLKERVVANPGLLVIRPDSGDPVSIVTETIERLMKHFGSSTNKKGYRVLPNNLRVIQGDGINRYTIEACLDAMRQKKQSAENITFGMGSALLQKVTRDNLRFAMKTNAVCRQGVWHPVFKAPVTDKNKTSKAGQLALIKEHNQYKTIQKTELNKQKNYLMPIFKDGELLQDWSLQVVRKRTFADD